MKTAAPPPQPFERAKLPMVLAAVGIALGLAIAGSLDKTPARAGDPAPAVPFGGAVVLAGWVVGIGALHRLGRAGSIDRSENRWAPVAPQDPAPPARTTDDEEDDDDEADEKAGDDEPKPRR